MAEASEWKGTPIRLKLAKIVEQVKAEIAGEEEKMVIGGNQPVRDSSGLLPAEYELAEWICILRVVKELEKQVCKYCGFHGHTMDDCGTWVRLRFNCKADPYREVQRVKISSKCRRVRSGIAPTTLSKKVRKVG